MTDTDTLDRVVVLLIEARDHLYGEIDALDDEEIIARTRLDEIIGRRAQRAAALTDLEQLIANHHTSGADGERHTDRLQSAAVATPAAHIEPAPAPVATSNEGRPSGPRGRPPRFEYPTIAAWITEAEAAGTYTTAALAAHFDVPLSTAKNWRSRCLALGLLAAEVVVAGPAPAVEEVPLEEIAATYLEAVSVDRKPIQTLVDRYDIDRTTANQWVTRCREQGLLPPRNEPQIPAEAPMQIRKHVNTGASAL